MPTIADQVTDAELARYARLIYDRTGISFPPQKKILLSKRVRRRLRATGLIDFRTYLDHLSRLPEHAPEWDAFLQAVTTHETYLFRDEAHWRWFRYDCLKELQQAAQAGTRAPRLKVWSAACSTGDEAYTIATCAAAALNLQNWQVQILGTDIAASTLDAARRANFGDRAMRLVPRHLRQRYFHESEMGRSWQPLPELRGLVRFRQHNLLQPPPQRRFDVVFLKNVLIYFDGSSKGTAIEHVRSAIAPGGWLVCGAAEGVADLLKDYDRLRPWLFRKPGGPRHAQ